MKRVILSAVAVLGLGIAALGVGTPAAQAQCWSCDEYEQGNYEPYVTDSYIVYGDDGTPWQVTHYSNGTYTVSCVTCYLPW